ncbi:MAG: acetate--CoA ligase family protein [Planctomycetota bacterium]|nr:acetate--CoA ligase family protein [Planctomycetota bacterium]
MTKPRANPKQSTRGSTGARASLDKLFRPRSVAVIGASRRPGSIGWQVLHNLITGGFEGKVFPVNPNADVLHSIKCHASVAAISDPVDMAIVTVPKDLAPRAIQDCARKGVGAVIVITAGFKETGAAGAKVEARMLATARKHGMRLVGPNCMGIQNAEVDVRLNASFARSFPKPGPVAFVSQSGAMGEAILAHADHLHLGVSMFVSMGNRADVSANDLIDYWGGEDSIRCILLYLESFGNPRNFVPIARRVSRDKAIVAVKAGRSAQGARAATSHTGALAGADVAADALLKECGVQRVDSVEELFDVGLALSKLPLPAGNRVAVLTNAGGPAILATDALIGSGLEIATLSRSTRTKLRKLLVPEASIENPVDMVAGATAENYRRALGVLLEDPGVDEVLVIFVPPITHDPVAVARSVFEAARGSRKPVVSCFMSRDEVLKAIASEAEQDWVPVYLYPESAVRALTALDERRKLLARPEGRLKRFTADVTAARKALRPGWLGVTARRALSAAYGIPAVPGGLARSPKEAVAIAERVGYPVVAKLSGPSVVHKSDVGGVLLDLRDEAAVRAAFEKLRRPDAEGVNVQKMLQRGREVVVGFAQDPAYGPLLMFGLGGIYVEVLKDVSFALCPVTDVRARELIREIRGWPILAGVRGQAGIDEAALVDVIQRLSQLAVDHPEIEELEINPLLAFPNGVCAVDMRVRVRDGAARSDRTAPASAKLRAAKRAKPHTD